MKKSTSDMILEIMASIDFAVIETDLARMIPARYPGRMVLPSTISRKLRNLAEGDNPKVYNQPRVVTGQKKNYVEWLIVRQPRPAALPSARTSGDEYPICEHGENAETCLTCIAEDDGPEVAQPPRADSIKITYAEYQQQYPAFKGMPWHYFIKQCGYLVADESQQLVWG